MTFTASVLTLYPDAFPGPLGVSLLETARKNGLWALETVDIRSFSRHKHASVDDTPAGGGPGMVLRPDVAAAAIDSLPRDGRPLIYLTPRGKPLTQAKVREWSAVRALLSFAAASKGWTNGSSKRAAWTR
jgi:tRNA (guanine37-N1)-methyltransferase